MKNVMAKLIDDDGREVSFEEDDHGHEWVHFSDHDGRPVKKRLAARSIDRVLKAIRTLHLVADDARIDLGVIGGMDGGARP